MADVSVRVFDGGTGGVRAGALDDVQGVLAAGSDWVWVDVPEPDGPGEADSCEWQGWPVEGSPGR